MKTLLHAVLYPLALVSILAASPHAHAGSKTLTVAVFDFAGGLGKASFKAMRTSGEQHRCWHESFGEITGIETAYIENLPAALNPADFQRALKGDAVAAERFRQSIKAAGLNGVYAFTVDVSGTYAVVHGMSGQSIAISSSASVRLQPKVLITPLQLSKELCPASKSMD